MPKELIKEHGFIPDVIEADQYVFGAYTKLVGEKLMPGGHGWASFLPDAELQNKNGLETMNCTNYGTLNCWETIALRRFGTQFNWSERYTGVLTGTTPSGNSPHKVAEVIRTESGVIDDYLLPFDETIHSWDLYYSPKPMRPFYLDKGKAFLTKYKLQHEWVFTSGTLKQKQDLLKEALEYSPLGVSVLAWKERGDKMWKKLGEGDNHWVELYDYEQGKSWMVYDHYDKTNKVLEWDYDFGFAKKYAIERQEVPPVVPEPQSKKNLLEQLLALLYQLLNVKPPMPTPPPPPILATSPWLLPALLWQESGGDNFAIGDNGKAFGCLQIWDDYFLDAMGRRGARECLGNRALSLLVFKKYMARYATAKRLGRQVTDQDIARIHNGGPNGHTKAATLPYWNGVKEKIKKLELGLVDPALKKKITSLSGNLLLGNTTSNFMSTIQASNYAIFVSLIVMIAGKFGITVPPDEVMLVITAIATVFSFVQRYKKGDLTVGGFRKENLAGIQHTAAGWRG